MVIPFGEGAHGGLFAVPAGSQHDAQDIFTQTEQAGDFVGAVQDGSVKAGHRGV